MVILTLRKGNTVVNTDYLEKCGRYLIAVRRLWSACEGSVADDYIEHYRKPVEVLARELRAPDNGHERIQAFEILDLTISIIDHARG